MPKRILTGKVTSNKSDKTITVIVERKIMHPMYKKFVTKSKKFSAHDSKNKFNITINFRKLLNVRNEIYASVLKLVNRQDLKSCGW